MNFIWHNAAIKLVAEHRGSRLRPVPLHGSYRKRRPRDIQPIIRVLSGDDERWLRTQKAEDIEALIRSVQRAHCEFYRTAIRGLWWEFREELMTAVQTEAVPPAVAAKFALSVTQKFLVLVWAGVALHFHLLALAERIGVQRLRELHTEISAMREQNLSTIYR